jgi:DNA-binding protein H-NS
MTDFHNKTPEELQKIIAAAQAQLEVAQRNKHKQVIAQIKELAASIGVTVEINEDVKKISRKVAPMVPPKYRNPNNFSETWTGRGLPPKWLKTLIDSGHNKDEFVINN